MFVFEGSDTALGAGAPPEEPSGTTPGTEARTPSSTTTATVETSTSESSGTNGNSNEALPSEPPAEDGAWEDFPKWIRDLRRESAGYRTRLRATEQELEQAKTKVQEFEQRDMTELQRAQTSAQTLEQQLAAVQKQLRDSQVTSAAAALQIQDPEAAVKLVDWDLVEKSGKSVNDALKELIESKPYLKAAPSTSEGQQGAGGENEATTTTANESSSTSTKRPADTKTSAGTPPKNSGQPKVFKKAEVRKLAAEDPDSFNELYENGGLKEAMANGRLVD